MLTSPFRRTARNETKRGGGGRRGGSYYDRYRLPQDNVTAFLLVEEDYVDPNPAQDEIMVGPDGRPQEVHKPFYKFRKHRVKLNQNDFRDEICSAGHNPHNPQPCVGCFHMDQGDRRVGVADNFAFTIVHLANYHRHPLLDRRTGGVVMRRDQPNTPVYIEDECLGGRTCNFCRVLSGQAPINDPQNPWPGFRPEDITTIFGKRRYLELGKNHLGDLLGWDASISSFCGNDGQQLITDGFKCPTCGMMIIDMNNPQEVRTDAQISEAVAQPYPCLQCNRPVILQEVVACEECERNSRQPGQLSVFNRVLFGGRQGQDTNSHLILQRHMSLAEFARLVDPRLLPQGKTFDQHLSDLAKPYDFEQIFRPKDLRGQSERLQLPLPPPMQYGGPPPGAQYGGTPPGTPQYGPGNYAPPAGSPPPGPPAPRGAPPAGAPQYTPYYSGAPAPGVPAPAPAPAPAPGPAAYQPPTPPHYGRN